MVEWLRPVVAAISVRDGWPARRTAEITIARLRRRRSSWRIPTDMSCVSSLPPPLPFVTSKAVDALAEYWQKRDSPVIYLFRDPKKIRTPIKNRQNRY